MGFGQAPLISKIGFAIGILGVLLIVVGVATNNWASASVIVEGKTASSSMGLFKICGIELGVSACYSYPDVPGWLNAVRALVLMSVIGGAASLAVNGIHLFAKNDAVLISRAGSALAFFAAGVTATGVAIFGAKFSSAALSSLIHLDWSFGLAIVGAIKLIIMGVLMIIGRRQMS